MTVELDEMKRAWAALELRQEGMQALLCETVHRRGMERARGSLGPLTWGQLAQLVVGAALAVWGGALWTAHLHQLPLLVCGLQVHAYGVLLIVFAARNLYLIRRIDYAAPVLEIQRRLAALRAFRVRVEIPVNAVVCCFMWIPVAWAAVTALGVQVSTRAFMYWAVGSGLAGLAMIVVAVVVVRLVGYGHKLDDHNAGRSIVRAQAALDDIARFERE